MLPLPTQLLPTRLESTFAREEAELKMTLVFLISTVLPRPMLLKCPSKPRVGQNSITWGVFVVVNVLGFFKIV